MKLRSHDSPISRVAFIGNYLPRQCGTYPCACDFLNINNGTLFACNRQIASAHDGTITYTTRAGHGATFKVCLLVPNQVM